MRLVFMGTPDYAVPSLKALAKEHDIVAVYSQPDRPQGRGYQLTPPPVKKKALAYHLPVYQPKRLRSPEVIEQLQNIAPDVIVVIAYGVILPPEILRIPRLGCVNAHASLLPRHRGAAPMQQAILEGDEITGVTTMLMDAGMDTGDILLQKTTPIGDKSIAMLHDELAELSAQLLLTTLAGLEQGEIHPQPQAEAGVSYTQKIRRSDGEVDFNLPADALMRRWRAYHPWPGLYTMRDGQMLKLIELQALPGVHSEAPGTVIAANEAGIDIAVQDGLIRVLQLQAAGKRIMSVGDYLRGNPLEKGSKLGD